MSGSNGVGPKNISQTTVSQARVALYEKSVKRDTKSVDKILRTVLDVLEKHPGATQEGATLLLQLVTIQQSKDLGSSEREAKLSDLQTAARKLRDAQPKEGGRDPAHVDTLLQQWAARPENSPYGDKASEIYAIEKLIRHISTDDRMVDQTGVHAKGTLGAGAGVIASAGVQTSFTGQRSIHVGLGGTREAGLGAHIEMARYRSTIQGSGVGAQTIQNKMFNTDWSLIVGFANQPGEPTIYGGHDRYSQEHPSLRGVSVGLLANEEKARLVVTVPVMPLPTSFDKIREGLWMKYEPQMLSLATLNESVKGKEREVSEPVSEKAIEATREKVAAEAPPAYPAPVKRKMPAFAQRLRNVLRPSAGRAADAPQSVGVPPPGYQQDAFPQVPTHAFETTGASLEAAEEKPSAQADKKVPVLNSYDEV